MPAITTFGVTASDIAERLQNFTVGTSSGPSTAQVGKIIDGQAGIWCSLLYSMGVQAPSTVPSTHAIYQLSREYIILRACAQAMRSRERFNPDVASAWVDESDRIFEMVKTTPSMLTDLRPTEYDSPNLGWSPSNDLANQARLAVYSPSQAIRNGAVYKV